MFTLNHTPHSSPCTPNHTHTQNSRISSQKIYRIFFLAITPERSAAGEEKRQRREAKAGLTPFLGAIFLPNSKIVDVVSLSGLVEVR